MILPDQIQSEKTAPAVTEQERVISLFTFLGEMNKLKQNVVVRLADHPWSRTLSSLPEDAENIRVSRRSREEDDEHADNVLLSVHKPGFEHCPAPDDSFAAWLEPGWENYLSEVSVKASMPRTPEEDVKKPRALAAPEETEKEQDGETGRAEELFEDDNARAEAFSSWMEQRESWAERQKVLSQTREFFSQLYRASVDLDRDAETLELVIADGFLRDREMPELDHPILTRRVKIRHDAVENTIYIEDENVSTELYAALLKKMKLENQRFLSYLMDDLLRNDYHPLDRQELPDFFRSFIHQLSPESFYSDCGVPADWQKKDRYLLYRDPCLILRRRMDGATPAIESIVRHVAETGEVPAPIADIVGGGRIEVPESREEGPIEEQLAAVGGESADILLSKEANKEQMEIARRIEQYNAVLVQGPPGTGKTHTIANLMGHFLAQGKSVLVTSHTRKALSVLKEKVVPGLQSLCVSVLDDSNMDMERSVDGVTEYLSNHTSFEVKKEMEALGEKRQEIILDLADVRKQLFSIISRENGRIVWLWEEVTPSEAAKFVQENSETLSYIPGTVKLYQPLPLSLAELTELYQSNGAISAADEVELDHEMPQPEELLAPDRFEELWGMASKAAKQLNATALRRSWVLSSRAKEGGLRIKGSFGEFTLTIPTREALTPLTDYLRDLPRVKPWMRACALAGKKGGVQRKSWLQLIEELRSTAAYAEKLADDCFGKSVNVVDDGPEFADSVFRLRDKYRAGGLINWLPLPKKSLERALNGAEIDGEPPRSEEDCDLILRVLELRNKRDQCAVYWDELFERYEVPAFCDLDSEEPERAAAVYIPHIQRFLDWFQNDYSKLKMSLEKLGLPCEQLFRKNELESEEAMADHILAGLEDTIPAICHLIEVFRVWREARSELERNNEVLRQAKYKDSAVCRDLLTAAAERKPGDYRAAFTALEQVRDKRELRSRRFAHLDKLAVTAPQWAEAIRNREGIHGKTELPEAVEEAWKWKQYCGIIEEITADPFPALQTRSLKLSRAYREVTAKYAECAAWYHLLCRTENDLDTRHALVGWKQTVKKLGKGTGKNAPMYRAKARELMARCQTAVPGWIMPVSKALENLDPCTNRFDVIIIDEASQSDLSALAILYMGKKLIIVGDDKQVSPMAIGVRIEETNALKEMYLAGKIPNDHLYDARTSVYDIAATTFQPLMLHEHFRCVPEIIGFSNWLSYDFKIKPLRDCSNSALLPAVVNYRVEDGWREDKTNPNEARAVVALMRACMEQPEYAGKTFGIISLLGDEQVGLLQEEIYTHIDLRDVCDRHILCGNASNFQGDERDVVFLSVVSCANGDGPLSRRNYCDEDAKKRFNVAASRARDQLWVVDSLDPSVDLQPDDLRKKLIDYSIAPETAVAQNEEIEKKSESPFEAAVAHALTDRGYHLVQQWRVGAYRLDMVVLCGGKKVAIECDGERWHSGEEKIRADMERQAILERLGWQFIRIRGSEYYRDPEKTIWRVAAELNSRGIMPEHSIASGAGAERETELLRRVKRRAQQLLEEDRARRYVPGEQAGDAGFSDMPLEAEPVRMTLPEGQSQEPEQMGFQS